MKSSVIAMRKGAAVADITGALLAVVAVLLANRDRIPSSGLQSFLHMRLTLLNAAFAIGFAYAWQRSVDFFGLRDNSRRISLSVLIRIVQCSSVMTVLLALYLLAKHATQPLGTVLVMFFVSAITFEFIGFLIAQPSRHTHASRVVILGSGRRAGKAWRELRTRYHKDKTLVGFVDDRDISEMSPDIADRYICGIPDLSDFLLENAIDEIIVATPLQSSYETTQRAVAIAEAMGVRVLCLSDIYTLRNSNAAPSRSEMFVELVPAAQIHLFGRTVKRILDVVVASALLLAGLPLLLVFWISSTFGTRPAVVRKRVVYGYRRTQFILYSVERDGGLPHRAVVSLLLKMVSVLRGELSLVGPRPLTQEELASMSASDLTRRFCVRPGVTGIWRSSTVAAIPSGDSVEVATLSARSYLDDWSLLLDIRLLGRAYSTMLKRTNRPQTSTGTA